MLTLNDGGPPIGDEGFIRLVVVRPYHVARWVGGLPRQFEATDQRVVDRPGIKLEIAVQLVIDIGFMAADREIVAADLQGGEWNAGGDDVVAGYALWLEAQDQRLRRSLGAVIAPGAQRVAHGDRVVDVVLELDGADINVSAEEIRVRIAVKIAVPDRRRPAIEPRNAEIRRVVGLQMVIIEGQPGRRAKPERGLWREAEIVVARRCRARPCRSDFP